MMIVATLFLFDFTRVVICAFALASSLRACDVVDINT
jgi:hypothetical protein